MIVIVLYVAVVSSYCLLASFDESVITNLGVEDGLIENIGAVGFLIASCLYWFCYFKSTDFKIPFTSFKTKRNLFFLLLLLGLIFLICLGEEIRWGQGIFNWETPEFLKNINDHQEISLHNIPLINTEDYRGKTSLMWMKHIHIKVFFSIFWLVYCVFVPLLSKFSPKAHRQFKKCVYRSRLYGLEGYL